MRYTLIFGSVAVDDDGTDCGGCCGGRDDGTIASDTVETGIVSTLGLKFDANGLLAIFHLILSSIGKDWGAIGHRL